MDSREQDFIGYAQKHWGLKYPWITDDELGELVDLRVLSGNYAENLSEFELQPFHERLRQKELEETSAFEAFKAEALENWAVWYPALPSESVDRILSMRKKVCDYSLKLSLSERGPMLLAEKAKQAERELAQQAKQAEREQELLAQRYPSRADEEAWLSSRSKPLSQPYGVSYDGAEHLMADWLRYLGEKSVEVTQLSGDGGVDVLTDAYCCQVKNYSRQNVSSSEVRDLLGTALSMQLKPLLFTSTGLTSDAEKFASDNSISAIKFDAVVGALWHLNESGRGFLFAGRYGI